MKNLVTVFVAFCFVFALVSIGLAADMKVEGKVEKIEGEFVIVKDAKGKEHKLHTDDSTQKIGEIKTGAEVEAIMTSMGHAKSITVKEAKGEMKK